MCALDAREIQVPATDRTLENVELCLKHNNSQFVDNHYLQAHGTLGMPVAMLTWLRGILTT